MSSSPGSFRDANINVESQSAFLPSASIAIIGLGLIGGSLALSLRHHCSMLFGIDHDPEIVRQALVTEVVDDASTDPSRLLPQANLIVFAVPVLSSLELIQRLPSLHPGHAMVMDMGSTKCEVIRAMSTLPERFDPIGGHPMCGKENGTLANAEMGLFRSSAFALVPMPRTSGHCKQVALELVTTLGAHPVWLEADEHDRRVASTSHLPHLLATALTLSTPLNSASLAGPGFLSTSRLAAGSATMKTDIFATNRQSILAALASFQLELDQLSEALQREDIEKLHQLLALGAEKRQAILIASENNNG
jgi:prephenate dehydrogenase